MGELLDREVGIDLLEAALPRDPRVANGRDVVVILEPRRMPQRAFERVGRGGKTVVLLPDVISEDVAAYARESDMRLRILL